MLFLGAEASNALGIGHLPVLTSKIINRLKNTKHNETIDHIITVMNRMNNNNKYYPENEIDIEVILSVLNKSAAPECSLKELGPYAIFRSCDVDRILSIDNRDLQDLNEIIDEEITNHFQEYNKDKAFDLYDKLINFDNNTLEFRTHTPVTKQKILSNIVTLNYDLVVETVFNKLGQGLTLGLKAEFQGGDYYVDLEQIFTNNLQPNEYVKYLKLQGSIDWRIRDSDEKIVKRDTGLSLSGNTATRQLMIYPIFDNKISDEFYFTFYYLFKRILLKQDIYLIVGYSFRDQSINDDLYFGLKYNTSSRMIVTTTNKTVIDRINKTFEKVQSKIDFLDSRFGNEDFIEKLSELL